MGLQPTEFATKNARSYEVVDNAIHAIVTAFVGAHSLAYVADRYNVGLGALTRYVNGTATKSETCVVQLMAVSYNTLHRVLGGDAVGIADSLAVVKT